MNNEEGQAAGPSNEFIELEPGSEWRFELEADENIAVRVHTADPIYINSSEIPRSTWYPLHRYLKSALYGPSGGRLEVSALPGSQYSSTTTSQPALVSLHLALERQRILARRHIAGSDAPAYDAPVTRGPRVMVLGPPNSGKTTVVKNLVNMALGSGMGWSPGVIGLDPSSPSNLIPGSLSLSTPVHPIPTHHLAHPLGSPPGSVAANTLSGDVSTMGWWYGHVEPSTKGMDLWMKVVDEMAGRWKERCDKDPNAMASGLIMDTSSAFAVPTLGTRKTEPKSRYSLVLHAAEAFEIETLLVIGNEKLSIDLSRLLPALNIIRLPKSSGVVDRDEPLRETEHTQIIRSYFYGEPALPKEIDILLGKMVHPDHSLSPYSFQIGWETLTILRVGEENAAPTSALPLGSARTLSRTKLSRVDPAGPAHVVRLLNTVLAVVAINKGDWTGAERKRKVKEEVEEAVKVECVKEEGAEGGGEGEGGDEGEQGEGEDEEDEDEVPYKEEIGWREVLGFIVITAIDTQRKKYTILSPSPGKLPSTVAIAGSIEWVDSA
ncbi:Pre-mRNA cleavage complex II protein Clp1-domain-containing protein [Dioszegia hungarica]|uniref:Polynucleotide 5'-hydroxyl-kinase GRC3 n=1 Tax=Dioszegia hungarica TaxID=4972 RepID=A0AA38HCQ2_9TREE|nr:Pre-mRNA cleavage complex II protein Clp1-domain-containing protein [Dioszegia hungarica]KAI9637324.1 Pre-mRNA cleavage complex II protein Clp1-domain-containing protein [Dioszegia hungarica]